MSVLKLRPEPAAKASAAETTLADLHKQRRALVGEMNDIHAKILKVQAAPLEIGHVRAELAALGASEQAAASRWVDAGAEGEPPTVDIEARADLAKRLAAAEAQSAASEAAIGALNAKNNGLGMQVNALNVPITTAATEILLDRLDAQVAEAKALVEKLTPLVGSIDSLRNVIIDEAHRINNLTGGHAGEFFRRLENVPPTKTILSASPPNHFAEWVRELEALKRGDGL